MVVVVKQKTAYEIEYGLVGSKMCIRDSPERRKTALLYAGGILFAQLLWVGRLWLPESWWIPTFFAGVAVELLVPVVAETLGGRTPFHPHHLAERYSLLTIIVLGEVILSSVQAVQGAMASAAAEDSGGASGGAGLHVAGCLLYTSPWPRNRTRIRIPTFVLKKKKRMYLITTQ